jgi:hypothetical protein
MTRLHYCSPNYEVSPPLDINPLLLRLYEGKNVLIVCAREGMYYRIQRAINSDNYYGTRIEIRGIWEEDKTQTFNRGLVTSFDAVIVIGRKRIDESYEKIMKAIESYCSTNPLQ